MRERERVGKGSCRDRESDEWERDERGEGEMGRGRGKGVVGRGTGRVGLCAISIISACSP